MSVSLSGWIRTGMILQGSGFKPEFFKIEVDGCFISSQNLLSLETICMSSSIMEVLCDPGSGILQKVVNPLGNYYHDILN